MQDADGDENWHVYRVDLRHGKTQGPDAAREGRRADRRRQPPRPDEMLIGLNDRDAEFHDIYRVNIVTRRAQAGRAEQAGLFSGYLVDDDLQRPLRHEIRRPTAAS